jgi:hypothetical protein
LLNLLLLSLLTLLLLLLLALLNLLLLSLLTLLLLLLLALLNLLLLSLLTLLLLLLLALLNLLLTLVGLLLRLNIIGRALPVVCRLCCTVIPLGRVLFVYGLFRSVALLIRPVCRLCCTVIPLGRVLFVYGLFRPVALLIRPVCRLYCTVIPLGRVLFVCGLFRPVCRLCRAVINRVNTHYFIIRLRVPGNLGKPRCIDTIICCCAVTPSCNCLVRVLLPVCIAINHTRRARFWCFINCRPVNVNGIVLYPLITRTAGIIDPVHLNILIGNPSYILHTGAGNISCVIINISVINNSGVMYNGNSPLLRHIVIINIGPVYILLRRTYPVIIRCAVSAAN